MSLGRMYKAIFDAVSVTVEQDLFEILAPTDAVVIVHSIDIGQELDAGDAEAEMLSWKVVRGEGSVTTGSGGTTPTARPVHKGDAAFGGTVKVNNTTKMAVGTGALVDLGARTFNVQIGLFNQWAPDEREVISPGDRLTIELAKAPVDPLTMSGTIVFEELGG